MLSGECPLFLCDEGRGLSFAFPTCAGKEMHAMERFSSIMTVALLLVALSVIATGCGGSPTPTSTPTPLPTPTLASIPSPTPEPTATPVPSPTTIPTATAQLYEPVTIVDSNGREVVFEEPPQRIIAYDSAVVEILFSLGEGQRVVATHNFATYPPETEEIPKLGGAFNMSIEQAVALEPDLVFLFFDQFLPDLEKVGLKVLYIRTLSQGIPEIAEQIRMWGRITGNVSAGEEVAGEFEARLAAIQEKMAPVDQGPRLFHDTGDLWTPGPDSLVGEVYTLLKAENIAQDISGYAQLSPEVIVARDPEVIITSESYLEGLTGNPAFQGVSAVKNGRVLVPQADLLSIAGPRFVDGIEDMARLLYTDLFSTVTLPSLVGTSGSWPDP